MVSMASNTDAVDFRDMVGVKWLKSKTLKNKIFKTREV